MLLKITVFPGRGQNIPPIITHALYSIPMGTILRRFMINGKLNSLVGGQIDFEHHTSQHI